MFPIRG